MYRLTTSDGTAFIVAAEDLDLIRAYLVLSGYPALSVEVADLTAPELDVATRKSTA